MFGGLCFMVSGHMTLGTLGSDLCVRIGKDNHDTWVTEPGARTMDFTGRPMRSMLVVSSDAIADDAVLEAWVDRALGFVATLPPK